MLQQGFPREAVTRLVLVQGPPDRLGERTASYQPGEVLQATLTPVTAEQAVRAGLTTTVTRLYVRARPAVVLAPGDRLLVRGSPWKVVNAAVRQSYTTAMIEKVVP